MNVSFSIITPVFNPPRDAFAACAQSVLDQDYPHWEWCLANDASTEDWVRAELDRLAASDPRIKVVHRYQNGGISNASNSALEHAAGDFITFLDHDDMLTPDALGAVNHYLSINEDAEFFYSDESRIDEDGKDLGTFKKAAWSPERLLCVNYCCHLVAIKRDIIDRVGPLRPEFDGAQDYDLVLRATEAAKQVVHIPRTLYHWRAVEGSTASSIEAKPYAVDAGRRAVAEALKRRGISGVVVPASQTLHRVKRTPAIHPKISIIVPTAGTTSTIWGLEMPLIVNMLHSVRQLSTYDNIEIVIVADTPVDQDLTSQLTDLIGDYTLVEYSKPFNFSEKCNLGAMAATGEMLIFANDDLEVITPDWIESMLGFFDEPDVGAVGPLLLFDNFTIQSAGHTAGPGDYGRGWPYQRNTTDNLLINRECVGVTAACLMMRADDFSDIGGFSMGFSTTYSDVDLCYKLLSIERRIIWTPNARLIHFESRSRKPEVRESETLAIGNRWGHRLHADPYLR